MIPTAVSSTVDGSIVIGVDMNVSDAEKELVKLKKKIENIEGQIKKTELKRTEAEQKGLISQSELDAEKAKLDDLTQSLKEMREVAKDKSYSPGIREEAKSQIASTAEAVKEQRERVRMLQTEYNKIYNSVDRYDQKLKDLNNDLETQKAAAGGLERDIAEGNERFRQMAEEAGIADQHIIDLNKELSNLISRQKELESAGIGLGYAEYDQNAARIADITQELKEYKKALTEASNSEKSAMPDSQKTDHAANSQRRMNTYLEKSGSLYQKLRDMIGQTTKISGSLQDIAASTGGKFSGAFETAGKAVGSMGTAFSGVITKIAPFVAVISIVIKIINKMVEIERKFERATLTAFKEAEKAVASFSASVARAFVSSLKAIGKFGSTAVKVLSGITKKFVDFSKNLNVFSKISDALKGKFKQLGSTLKSALVFSVIYNGLSMLKQQIGSYLAVNDQFMTAVRRMQGVLLTAFQPIYDVVVPALTTLINVMTHAAATIAQFFASLFGTTAKRAQANAENLYNQATATTAVGDAAEEAAKQLAGFDEINKLEGTKKAGGGGATSVDMGPLFDYEYDETPFKPWGEAFSDFLDKLLGGIPKLEAAFKKFADWLNDFAKKLYDMFTFPGVLDKVKQLGRDLAEALNKLVNWIDWEMLGRALGAGLNLALNFLTSFLYTFDWMNLGRKLAEFINGLADEIDWYEFGRLLWAGFKIGLETLAGFIVGLNMPLMADAATRTIIGFFNEMKNTVNRIPWDEIGQQIASFLNHFDWYGTIISMFEAISAGLMGLKTMVDNFLLTFDWRGTADAIARAVNEAIDLADWGGIGETIGYAIQEAFAFVEELVSQIKWYEIGQNIADFILDFDFVGALGGLADMIAAGINAAIMLARGFLERIMPEAENIAKGIVERLKTAIGSVHWDELGRVVGDGIKTALKFVAGLLDPSLFYEIGKAVGDFLIGLDWPGIIGGLAEVLANAINSAVAAVKGFLDSVQPNLKQIAEDIGKKINEFVEKVNWADLGQTISRGIESAIDFLITLLDTINWDKVGNAVADLLENIDWKTLLSKLGTAWGKALDAAMELIDLSSALNVGMQIVAGIAEGFMNKFNESGGILGWLKRFLVGLIIDGVLSLFGIHSPSTVFAEIGENLIAGLQQGISDTWHNITDFFSEKLEPLKTLLSDAWESIKTTASQKWETIKNSTLGQAWTQIRDLAKDKFEEVRGKVSEAWNNVKSDVPGKWEAIRTTLSTAWGKVKTTAEEKFREVKEKIIEKLDEVKDKDWFQTGKSVVDGILRGLESIWNSLLSWARNVKDTIADALSGATGSRGGGFGTTGRTGTFGGYRMAAAQAPDISNFNIPALAQGAVIPPNREFLAVLGDQKTGTNIETPVPTMIQAFEQALKNVGMAGGTHTVILQVGETELGRVVYRLNNKEQQRIGVRLVEART